MSISLGILRSAFHRTENFQQAQLALGRALRKLLNLSHQHPHQWRANWRLLNDPQILNRASARELASIAALAAEKRQLLRGEPTQVIRIQDIRKLDEMAKALHEEMERRGMLIDVTPEKSDGGNDDGRDASGD